jgi:autotransporter-associated beta strand protein
VANFFTLNGGDLTITTSSSTQYFNTAIGVTVNAPGGSITVSNGAADSEFRGVVTGSGNLTKLGNGTLTLNATNTYSGNFVVSAGSLELARNSALGNATTVTVNSAAILLTQVTGLTNAINDAAAFVLNGGADVTGGSETIGSLSGSNSTATLTIGLSGATNGNFTVGDSTSTTFLRQIGGNVTTAGATILTKQGTGILTLGGNNTHIGVTAITAGGLTLTHSNALGANGTNNGTTVSSGAVLGLDGSGGALAVGNELLTINGLGLASSPAGALRNIAGSNSLAGAITLGSNSTITASAGNLTLSGGIVTASGKDVTFDDIVVKPDFIGAAVPADIADAVR